MRRVLVEKNPLPEPGRPARLPETEARHLIGALRLSSGDEVLAIDGRGNAAVARLRVAGTETWLDHVRAAEAQESGKLALRLELALLKADAMAWVIEKAVELGVDRLVPVIADHCVVKVRGKAPSEFQDRWQRIADQALKQCGRLDRMAVEAPRALADLEPPSPQRPRLFCDEGARDRAPGLLLRLAELGGIDGVNLLVGPEGGWSEGERARILAAEGILPVSLGPHVLRAETAALFAIGVTAASLRWPAGLADLGRKS